MGVSFSHLVSASDITRQDADFLVEFATEMDQDLAKRRVDGEVRKYKHALEDEIMGLLFYQPSTRTSVSFEAASKRLGGSAIVREGVAFSSISKGETLQDTIRVVGGMVDGLIMRHPDAGGAKIAADRLEKYRTERKGKYVPFINAGDGNNEHPTQALLDLYTIKSETGTLDNLNVALAGDLLNGRTVHSLVQLLSQRDGTRFTFAAPDQLRMPEKFTTMLRERGVPYEEVSSLTPALKGDILYMTRVQGEHFKDKEEYERLKHYFELSYEMVEDEDAVIMHPLPRVGEIHETVDPLWNAAYFRQADNGLPMRMALIHAMIEKARIINR